MPVLGSSQVRGAFSAMREAGTPFSGVAAMVIKLTPSPLPSAGLMFALTMVVMLLVPCRELFGLKNLITPEQMPYSIGRICPYEGDNEYDTGDYPRTMDLALQAAGEDAACEVRRCVDDVEGEDRDRRCRAGEQHLDRAIPPAEEQHARAEAGAQHHHLHHLLLEDGHAQGAAQRLLQLHQRDGAMLAQEFDDALAALGRHQ